MSALFANRQSSSERRRRRHRQSHRRTPSNDLDYTAVPIYEESDSSVSTRENSRATTPTALFKQSQSTESAALDKQIHITIPEETSGELKDDDELQKDKFGKEQPKTICGRLKDVYDRCGGKHSSPVLILIIYSLVGAGLFYLLEYDNEQSLIDQDKVRAEAERIKLLSALDKILVGTISGRALDTKRMETLAAVDSYISEMVQPFQPAIIWDFWGSLFFVGTVYTTIGYGNIYPRTTGGQALAMLYAIFGIPLVLAILNDLGKLLCKWSNKGWRKVRKICCCCCIAIERRRNAKARKNTLSIATAAIAPVGMSPSMLSSSMMSSMFETDSETMPVTLAISLCISYILLCSGLFLLWEHEWNYFTAVYFFFISLSTIGLGDIVPSKPKMMILNFWLVIVGLSLVSMTINVIQQKIEQWLFEMMQRIQEEYQRALEMGDCPEKDKILEKLMKNQPWYLRKLMPALIGDKAKQQLEEECVHQQEVNVKLSGTNSKAVQTEKDNEKEDTEVADVQTDLVDFMDEGNQANIIPESDDLAMQTSLIDTKDHSMQSSFQQESSEVALSPIPSPIPRIEVDEIQQSAPVDTAECGIQYDHKASLQNMHCQTHFEEDMPIEQELLLELEEKLTQTSPYESMHEEDVKLLKELKEKLIQTSPWTSFNEELHENWMQTNHTGPIETIPKIEVEQRLTQTSPLPTVLESCMQTSLEEPAMISEQKLVQTSPMQSFHESAQTNHIDVEQRVTQTSPLPSLFESAMQTSLDEPLATDQKVTQTNPLAPMFESAMQTSLNEPLVTDQKVTQTNPSPWLFEAGMQTSMDEPVTTTTDQKVTQTNPLASMFESAMQTSVDEPVIAVTVDQKVTQTIPPPSLLETSMQTSIDKLLPPPSLLSSAMQTSTDEPAPPPSLFETAMQTLPPPSLLETSMQTSIEKLLPPPSLLETAMQTSADEPAAPPPLLESAMQTLPPPPLLETAMQTSIDKLSPPPTLLQTAMQTSIDLSLHPTLLETAMQTSTEKPVDSETCQTQTSPMVSMTQQQSIEFYDNFMQTSPLPSIDIVDMDQKSMQTSWELELEAKLTQTSPHTSIEIPGVDSICQTTVDQSHSMDQAGCSSWSRPDKVCQTMQVEEDWIHNTPLGKHATVEMMNRETQVAKQPLRDDCVQTQACFILDVPAKLPSLPTLPEIDCDLSDSYSQTEDIQSADSADIEVQTEDSYLKIAHRLDELRFNRSHSLAIMSAKKRGDDNDTNGETKGNREGSRRKAASVLAPPAYRSGTSRSIPPRSPTPGGRNKSDGMSSSTSKLNVDTDEDYSSSSDILSSSSGRNYSVTGPRRPKKDYINKVAPAKPLNNGTAKKSIPENFNLGRRESEPNIMRKKVSLMRLQFDKV